MAEAQRVENDIESKIRDLIDGGEHAAMAHANLDDPKISKLKGTICFRYFYS